MVPTPSLSPRPHLICPSTHEVPPSNPHAPTSLKIVHRQTDRPSARPEFRSGWIASGDVENANKPGGSSDLPESGPRERESARPVGFQKLSSLITDKKGG